ncbi:hypothetical protein JOC34_003733 [Virgibacillus halotolerans]|nr:hypothetical protein [Virgibacillus halotolerans]
MVEWSEGQSTTAGKAKSTRLTKKRLLIAKNTTLEQGVVF